MSEEGVAHPVSAFPYSLDSLVWDDEHWENEQKTYCYCGKGRDESDATMIMCEKCMQWFHPSCCSSPMIRRCAFSADFLYRFRCEVCTSGSELYTRIVGSWKDVCLISAYNVANKSEKGLLFRAMDTDFFLDDNWDYMCLKKERTPTWFNTVHAQYSTGRSREGLYEMAGIGSGVWYFAHPEVKFWVNALFHAAKKNGKLPDAEFEVSEVLKTHKDLVEKRKGMTKRQPPPTWEEMENYMKEHGDRVERMQKMQAEGTWRTKKEKGDGSSHKRKRDDKHKKNKNKGDKLDDRPIILPVAAEDKFPPVLVEQEYGPACWSVKRSAPAMKIGSDRLTVYNEAGYRMARASYGVEQGCWYWEITILDPLVQEGRTSAHPPALRIGVATMLATPEAPVGYGRFGYSYRNMEGTKVHNSRRGAYGEPFGPGDTIGVLICMGGDDPSTLETAKLHLGDTPEPPANESGMGDYYDLSLEPKERVPLSFVEFFKNGVSQGVAFRGLFQGVYYPAVASYCGGHCAANFGPDFKYRTEGQYAPISSLAFDEPEGMSEDEQVRGPRKKQKKRSASADVGEALAKEKEEENAPGSDADEKMETKSPEKNNDKSPDEPPKEDQSMITNL